MNRHRGGFAVESAQGAGATFSVYFPLANGGAAETRARAPGVVTKVS